MLAAINKQNLTTNVTETQIYLVNFMTLNSLFTGLQTKVRASDPLDILPVVS